MSGREVKPGGASLTDAQPAASAAPDRPGATTLVQREGQRTQPVPAGLRARLEAATGADLGAVRLHTGPEANQKAEAHGARAVTIGQDIYFRDGESIDGAEGEQLVAHEVAHTVQNRKSGGTPGADGAGAGVTSPGDAGENEARQFANAIVSGGPPPKLVESLGGAIARDALLPADDLAKKKKPADLFSGPVTWAVLGDSFEVRLHRLNGELVTDITYLGTYPVDSSLGNGAAQPTRTQRITTHRHAPPDDRKDLPFSTKMVARSSNTLMFDLFGDGIELLTVRDECDADDYAKFDRRRHRMQVGVNGNTWQHETASFELHLPTGDGRGGPEGEREAIASRKIKLLRDEFMLRARRHGDSGEVVLGIVNAQGEHQVIVPLKGGAPKRLGVEVLQDDGRTLSIDLDCDGKPDATLVHTMRQFPPPSATGRYRGGHLSRGRITGGIAGGVGVGVDPLERDPSYVHEIASYDPGGVLLGRMIQKMPGYPGVIPPEQDANKTPPPDGAAQPADKAPQQPELLPGQVPEAIQSTGKDWELRIDGDGDRTAELLLRFVPLAHFEPGKPANYTLRATQISSGVSAEGPFSLTADQALQMNAFGPQLTRAADGHTFGEMDLGAGAIMSFGVAPLSRMPPEGHTRYDFVINGTRLFFQPPAEKADKARLTQDDGKGPLPTKNVAGIRAVDIPLTEYGDKFRVTIQKDSSDWVLFGLSALQDGTQIGGIHTRLIGVEEPRLEEFSVLPDHASFTVDPKNGMDPLNISSALDPPKDPQGRPIQGIPPTSHRDHRITVWGHGVSGELTQTFQVRHGKFVPKGWDKDKDAQLAAGGADTVGVLQEQAKHPHLAEYKIQIDAALDAAITSAVDKQYISAKDAEAWSALRTSMVLIDAQANANVEVSATQVATAEKSVMQIDHWLEWATNKETDADGKYDFPYIGPSQAKRTAPGSPGPSVTYTGTVLNTYTGQKFAVKDSILGEEKDKSTTYGRLVNKTLEAQQWPQAAIHYNKFRDGVRRWLKTKYERDAKKDEPSAGAAQLDYLGKMAEETGRLDKIQADRLSLDNSLDTEVLAAAEKGVIRKDIGATWKKLREEMILLTTQTSSEQPDKELTASGVSHVDAITTWLATATRDQTWSTDTAKGNSYTGEAQLKVGDEWATSAAWGTRLAEQLQAGQVQLAGQLYNKFRDGVVRWIVHKYTTDPKVQDPVAAARLGGLQEKRKGQRDVVRIPAIYQADESFEKMPDAEGYKQADFGKYKTVPLSVFVWVENNKWHIRDVTNPDKVWEPETVDFNDEDQPPEALFKKLDHSRHLPKGHISYQLPDGTGNRIRLESKKPWYDYCKEWAMYIGLAALAVLATAATFGAAAAVAIPVFVAVTTSAALSIAGDIGELYDGSKEGFLDSEMIFMNVLDIASNLAALATGGAGKLAMGAEAAALAERQGTGAAWTGMKAFAGKVGSMAYRPLMGANIMGNALNAIIMSDAMIAQLKETDSIEDFWSALYARAKIIATWAATTGMAVLSLRGDLPSFGKGAPKITLDNVNGKMVARLGNVHVGKTVVELPHANNANEHAGARWQAEELEHTAKTGSGDAKADATAALTDAEFQKWYAKWLEDPKRIGSDGKVRVPADTPHGYAERAQAMVDRGDAKLRQQAFDTADEVAKLRAVADQQQLEMNPSSESWKGTREKLEKQLEGEWGKERTRMALDRYEMARRGATGDPADFVTQRAKIDKALPESEIERIKGLYPGNEVHVTGDLTAKQATPGKGPDSIEVAVVVSNDTPAETMAAMEQRANGHKVVPDPEYSKATGKESLGLRVKVMTEDQFFGMATASRKGKAAPAYVRIDQSVSEAIDAGVPVREQSPTQYAVEADKIATAREHMASKPTADGRVGTLQYNPKTNSVYFDVHGAKVGNRIRIEAALPPKVTTGADLAHPNRIIGEPVKAGDAMDIMRRLNDGDLKALEKTGVHANGAEHAVPPGTEFGLGELPNGDLVVLRGELGAVDWANFPGVKPLAHTHPNVPGNNLQGKTKISVVELATAGEPGTAPNINRAVVYPTPEDLATVLARKVKEHVVVTPFHERDGQVFKPDAANGVGRPLDFVISNIEEVGTVNGQSVYKARVVGVAGGEAVIPAREVWGVVDPAGHNSVLDLRPPDGMIPKHSPVPTTSVKAPEPATTRAKIAKSDVETIAKEEMDRQGVTTKVAIEEPLPPEAFRDKFSSESGKAVFVLDKKGEGKIYTSSDARPLDVRAEVQHVKQMQDPAMGAEIRRLHGPDLEKNWDRMAASDRLEHFRRKLNIEIDAHLSLLDELKGVEREEVAGQLQNLRGLQKKAEALTPKELAEMNAGLRPMAPYLEDPAWLFNKHRVKTEAHADAPSHFPKEEKGMRLPDKGDERSAAYSNLKNVDSVHQVGTEWQEHWQITSGYDGTCTGRFTNAEGGTTVQITEKGGTVHEYDLEPNAEVLVDVDPTHEIKRGSPLGNDPPRRYRYVEITFKEKAGATHVDRRQEIRTSDGSWVQRGSESTKRGKAMERAAKAQADEKLAKRKEAAEKKGHYFDSHRLEYPQGSGGFDDVIVQFTNSAKKPKAKVRVREVKDYPNRHVPLEDFTAILPPGKGGHLDTNMDTLRRVVDDEVGRLTKPGNETLEPSGPFKGLSREQVFALGDAIEKSNIEFEVVLGPDTLIGREGAPGTSVLESLRDQLDGFFGKNVLKKQGGKYSPERVGKETADKFKPASRTGDADPDPDDP